MHRKPKIPTYCNFWQVVTFYLGSRSRNPHVPISSKAGRFFFCYTLGVSIFYKSRRVGKDGKLFDLYKFRTMIPNADQIGGSSTADDDPRITRIGRILRKTKLDELPQIWNWIKGDVALIGWRPEAQEYLSTIPPEVLATKCGIIGLATLGDFDEGATLKGKEDPDKYYAEVILPRKRELELFYAQNKSFKLDLEILTKTIWRIITRS